MACKSKSKGGKGSKGTSVSTKVSTGKNIKGKVAAKGIYK